MATPLPVVEVAKLVGRSRRTMFRLIAELGLTKYKMPGGGKAIYLDPDEVRRKLRPRRASARPSPGEIPEPEPPAE